jgi:hypothetical protein
MIEPSTAVAFSMFENRGVFALLLGSGLSTSAHVPTGWEIVTDLIRRVGTLEKAGEQSDWPAWYKGRFSREPNYSELLEELAHSPQERRAILHRYIEPTPEDLAEGRKVPTPAHRAIAKLVRDGYVRVIVTTNFDRLLENALRDEGVEPSVVKSDDDIKGAVPLIHSRCTILKVHGDYLDTRIRNTESELKGYTKPLNGLLDRILDEHGLIVCGWSADWDRALSAAIVRAPNRRYPLFWASRSKPSTLAADLIKQRGGRVLTVTSADDFFTALQSNIEAQEAIQRPNPATLKMLVATTKKYLSRAEYRIQLNDLIVEEARQLRTRLEGDAALALEGSFSATEFIKRVKVIEAACERLIQALCVLGRWGDGNELSVVSELVREFAKPKSGGGLTVWIAMPAYAGVLIVYAYGLGALRADRLKAVRDVWCTKVDNRADDSTKTAVQKLLLWEWECASNEYWSAEFPPNKTLKTPLSDHLHTFFRSALSDQYLSEGDYTRLFEKFEIIAGLVHLDVDSNKQYVETAAQSNETFVRVPMGRALWDGSNREPVLRELASDESKAVLLQAGFGDSTFLTAALQVLTRCMNYMDRRF